MRNFVWSVCIVIFVCVFISCGGDSTAQISSFAEIQKRLASDGSEGDVFGWTVFINGDYAIVGADGEDDGGIDAGAAYLFARNEGGEDNWGQVAKLTASDGEAGDSFGQSVSVSGDYVIVGADKNSEGGSVFGAAYLFGRNEGGVDNWGQVAKLTASDKASGDRFGHAVSISGDYAVVGAGNDDDDGTNSGSAYLFYRNGGGADSWGQVAKLTASDASAGDSFGWSAFIDGGYAIFGAYGDDDSGNTSGSAYLFYRDAGGADNWGQIAKLTASDGAAGDLFGQAVSLSGGYAIVGAEEDDDAGAGSGSAYLFHRNAGGTDNWGQAAKLTATDASEDDRFGWAASISGDYVIVGAYHDGDGGDGSGSAYLFHRNQGGTDNWGQVTKLIASDSSAGDRFGHAVSISDDYAIVGAYRDDDGGTSAGSVFFYRRE